MIDFRSNYSRFGSALSLSEKRLAEGDLPSAIALLQIAARYAYPANVGLFSSPRLESLLVEAGEGISTPSDQFPYARRDRRRILHVLTYGNPIGGDTRFAWRWIRSDRDSCHSVAITSQDEVGQKFKIPQDLKDAVVESGGSLTALSAPSSNPIEQARELRLLLRKADIAVLHIYPYDVIPLLALARECDSVKTIFVNHSDHTFWLGASVAHRIVHLRAQSEEFIVARRSMHRESRNLLLPIPLFRSSSPRSLIEAKRELGIASDEVVLLTIATPFKYSSPGTIGFLDLVQPIIQQFPKSRLIAIGPRQDGEWMSAHRLTDGRITALGKRHDTDLFYDAADVYLDSVPFSSITSLLEAGSRGVPLLGYDAGEGELALLGPGAPGIDQTMLLPSGMDSYRSLLGQLIMEPDFRRTVGEKTRDCIRDNHSGSGWLRFVKELYVSAEASTSRGCFSGADDYFMPGGLNAALSRLYPQRSMLQLVGTRLAPLSYSARVRLTWQLKDKGWGLCALNFLPRPTRVALRRVANLGLRLKDYVGAPTGV